MHDGVFREQIIRQKQFGLVVQLLKHVRQQSVIEAAGGQNQVTINFALRIGRRNAAVKQIIEPGEDRCGAADPLAMRRCA